MKIKLILPVLALLVGQVSLAAETPTTPVTSDDSDSVTQTAPAPQTQVFHVRSTNSRGVLARVIPQVSLIVSDVMGDEAKNVTSPKAGLGLGGVIDLGRSSFVFETGLLFRQLGWSSSSSFGTSYLSLDYLTIPLIAKYYFSESGSSMYIKGGALPSYAILKTATDSSGNSIILTNDNFGNQYNSFDVGATAGIGGRISMSDKTDFMIEANYMRGLLKIHDGSDVYNAALTVTAGVGINL